MKVKTIKRTDGNTVTHGALSFARCVEFKKAQSPRHRRRAVAILRPLHITGMRSGIPQRGNIVAKAVSNKVSGTAYTNYNTWGVDLSGIMQGAGGIGGLLAAEVNGQLLFPLYDANGNVTECLDTSGNVRAHYEYDAFGNITAQSGDLAHAFPFRFSTKYFDAETGLYYYGFRFYFPEWGGWVSRDLVGENGGENLYLFSANSPISAIDPVGLKWSSKLMGAEFYHAYQIIVPSKQAGAFGSVTEPFRGGRAFPKFVKYEPPVFEQNQQKCYCVRKGTGIADIEVQWWEVQMGVPGFNDLPEDIKDKWKTAINNGYKPRLAGKEIGVFENQSVVNYANWHERTEVAANRILYDNTIGVSEKRAQSNQCPDGAYKSQQALADHVKWDEAQQAYINGVSAFKAAFDPKFAPKAVQKNGATVLTINTPTSEYNTAMFMNILNPMKWN